MYQDHYGFRDKPFGLAPNPKFLYFNPAIRGAHDGLLADLRARKGVLLLTGDAGCGKTILLRQIWREIDDRDRVVNLHFTNLSLDDFLSFICENLGVAVAVDGREARIDAIAGFLAECGRQGQAVVLLIDEAENLRREVLAALPQLRGGDAAARSALQVVLVGRPGLEAMLSDQALTPLRQEVASVYRLERLAGDEVGAFIDHRLAVVGHKGACPFGRYPVALISRYSAGVPRLINTICDQALQLAVDAGRHRVSTSMVQQIAQDHGLEGGDEAAIAAIIDAEAAVDDDAAPAGKTAASPPASTVATDAAEDADAALSRRLAAEPRTGRDRRQRDRTRPAAPKRRRRRALLAATLVLAVLFVGFLIRPAALEPAFSAGKTGWLWFRAGSAGLAHSAFLLLEPGDGTAKSADPPTGETADGRIAEVTLLRAQRDALAAQLAALRAARDLSERQATAATTSRAKALSERAELQTQLDSIRIERDRLARAAAAGEAESADLNKRLDFSRNANAADRREIETRLVELAMVKMERDDLRRKLAAAQRRLGAAGLPTAAAPVAGLGAGSAAGPVNLIRKATSKAESADRVSTLMERADRQSRRGKLILPAGDNAVESYHDVLRLAPGHKRALAALDEIKGRYRKRAERARADGRLSVAGSYYKTILEIDPEDAEAKAALLTISGNTALAEE